MKFLLHLFDTALIASIAFTWWHWIFRDEGVGWDGILFGLFAAGVLIVIRLVAVTIVAVFVLAREDGRKEFWQGFADSKARAKR